MKKWLIEHLVCPECTREEFSLTPEIKAESDTEILEGDLCCPSCKARYPVQEGIAMVVPRATLPVVRGDAGYNSQEMLSAYLWSHYSEFFNGGDATDAYAKWAACFKRDAGQAPGWALDIGCSVGRLTFEMGKTHDRAIGIDTSLSFIRAARQLMNEKRLGFDTVIEGRITQSHACGLDPEYKFRATEFIVADATALPFRSGLFATAASVNILEKVPHPLRHLEETNRILNRDRASFIFSDPFTWDERVSHPDLWIGGRNSGPYKGRGLDNLCRLLQGEGKVFDPEFTVRQTGDVHWKIRKTQHLWEHITSQFVIAQRG